jgi:SpoVK/Ycf46/Vps4 family AAA+-type ATPase
MRFPLCCTSLLTLVDNNDGILWCGVSCVVYQGVFLAEWDGLSAGSRDLSGADEAAVAAAAAPGAGDKNKKGSKKSGGEYANYELGAPVVLLGATNRPMDLDAAFLRRMPVQIQTVMPLPAARAAILRAQLREEKLAADVDLEELALGMNNFTGSDIRELVRTAKQRRAKAFVESVRASMHSSASGDSSSSSNVSESVVLQAAANSSASFDEGELTREHFTFAINKTTVTGWCIHFVYFLHS